MKTELKIKILEAIKHTHHADSGLCPTVTDVLCRPDIFEKLTQREEDFYYYNPHMFLIHCGIKCPVSVKRKAVKEKRTYGEYYWFGVPADNRNVNFKRRIRKLDQAIKRLSKRLKKTEVTYTHTA